MRFGLIESYPPGRAGLLPIDNGKSKVSCDIIRNNTPGKDHFVRQIKEKYEYLKLESKVDAFSRIPSYLATLKNNHLSIIPNHEGRKDSLTQCDAISKLYLPFKYPPKHFMQVRMICF